MGRWVGGQVGRWEGGWVSQSVVVEIHGDAFACTTHDARIHDECMECMQMYVCMYHARCTDPWSAYNAC